MRNKHKGGETRETQESNIYLCVEQEDTLHVEIVSSPFTDI